MFQCTCVDVLYYLGIKKPTMLGWVKLNIMLGIIFCFNVFVEVCFIFI
jgi:hypothetical protein